MHFSFLMLFKTKSSKLTQTYNFHCRFFFYAYKSRALIGKFIKCCEKKIIVNAKKVKFPIGFSKNHLKIRSKYGFKKYNIFTPVVAKSTQLTQHLYSTLKWTIHKNSSFVDQLIIK